MGVSTAATLCAALSLALLPCGGHAMVDEGSNSHVRHEVRRQTALPNITIDAV